MRQIQSTLTIRRLGELDECSLTRLAELDSHEAPEAPHLGVEVEGRLLAAISLESGEAIADPFSRTAELVALLELRASQLRGREARLKGRLARRAAPAPAGSPALASAARVVPW